MLFIYKLILIFYMFPKMFTYKILRMSSIWKQKYYKRLNTREMREKRSRKHFVPHVIWAVINKIENILSLLIFLNVYGFKQNNGEKYLYWFLSLLHEYENSHRIWKSILFRFFYKALRTNDMRNGNMQKRIKIHFVRSRYA